MPARLLRSAPLVTKMVEGNGVVKGFRELASDVTQNNGGTRPELLSMATSVGHGAIEAYRASLAKGCGRVGVRLVALDFAGERQMLEAVQEANRAGKPGGTMVKIPLANRDHEAELCGSVAIARDVDGLSGNEGVRYRPVTPTAMRKLAEYALGVDYLGDAQGAIRVGVVGKGKSVGTPLVEDLEAMDFDPLVVTYSNAEKQAPHLRECDVIFTATGSESVLPEHVKRGAVIIDAGVRLDEYGVTRGDVHSSIYAMDDVIVTPPLGGVGPLTAAIMAGNVADAAARQQFVPIEDYIMV